MSGSPADRVVTYFPQFNPEYVYLSALSARTGATHVLATWPIFRLFPRGAHALSLWPYEQVRTGDVFCGHEWHRPPAMQPWLLVAKFPERLPFRVVEVPLGEGAVEPAYNLAGATSGPG